MIWRPVCAGITMYTRGQPLTDKIRLWKNLYHLISIKCWPRRQLCFLCSFQEEKKTCLQKLLNQHTVTVVSMGRKRSCITLDSLHTDRKEEYTVQVTVAFLYAVKTQHKLFPSNRDGVQAVFFPVKFQSKGNAEVHIFGILLYLVWAGRERS